MQAPARTGGSGSFWDMANTRPEVPEADALEQAQSVVPDDEEDGGTSSPKPKLDFEVPEADAIEQALDVPEDDDWR